MRYFARFGINCTILKTRKHLWRSVTFSKSTLLHRCFLRMLNCTNGTKSRKVSRMLVLRWLTFALSASFIKEPFPRIGYYTIAREETCFQNFLRIPSFNPFGWCYYCCCFSAIKLICEKKTNGTFPSHRNPLIGLECWSIHWFLCDGNNNGLIWVSKSKKASFFPSLT